MAESGLSLTFFGDITIIMAMMVITRRGGSGTLQTEL